MTRYAAVICKSEGRKLESFMPLQREQSDRAEPSGRRMVGLNARKGKMRALEMVGDARHAENAEQEREGRPKAEQQTYTELQL